MSDETPVKQPSGDIREESPKVNLLDFDADGLKAWCAEIGENQSNSPPISSGTPFSSVKVKSTVEPREWPERRAIYPRGKSSRFSSVG